jgi:phage tail-like protein
MDANGARFLLAPLVAGGEDLAFVAASRRLRLAATGHHAPPADRGAAEAAASLPRGGLDGSATFALLDPTRTRVLAGGAAPGLVEIMRAEPGKTFGDVALRPDGVLCAVLDGGGLRLAAPFVEDLDPPFAPLDVALPGFGAGRLALGPEGTLWVLERGGRALARLEGQPLPALLPPRSPAELFRPQPRNADPPRLEPVPLDLPPGRVVRSLASDRPGRLVLLLWPEVPEEAAVELLVMDGSDRWRVALPGGVLPFDLGTLGSGRMALLFAGWPPGRTAEAISVELPETMAGGTLPLAGAIYPLPGWDGGGFLISAVVPAHYGQGSGEAFRPRPLVALSRPAYARTGKSAPIRLDSGTPGFVWHRLYLEAALPPGTGVTVGLIAHDGEAEGSGAPHRFGVTPGGRGGPCGVWQPQRSELPFHPGLLGEEPVPDRCGLFACLAQASAGPDRALRGRWLDVQLTLHGDGRATPELAALRVWGPRFSYRDRYLPRLYRNPVAAGGDPDEAAGRIDFLDRFLALFEGVLTPMEDEVAAAFRLTAPAAAPAEALEGIAAWLDLPLEPALPVASQRRQLAEATALWRRRGTLVGLKRALDIATGDLAARGDIVVVEHFRLRRTMATVLGVRLEPEEDPLLPGRRQGGNSVVGRTLILGGDAEREFLALFRPEVLDAAEEEEVLRFLDEQADRVTVLVHRELPAETLGLVRRTVETEVPAHVEARVLAGSRPLLVGLSALLEVDTYTRPRPPRPGVVLDGTRLGAPAFLNDVRSLDPRLEGGTGA